MPKNQVPSLNAIAELEKSNIELMVTGDLPLPDFAVRYLESHPESMESVLAQYKLWQGNASKWLSNPIDPKFAYMFIDSHPAMWSFETRGEFMGGFGHTREESKMTEAEIENVFNDFLASSDMKIDGHASNLWSMVQGCKKKDKDRLYYAMEAGTAETSRYRSHHFHDTVMDTYGSSFEQCYVKTAKHLFATYRLGVERLKDGYGDVTVEDDYVLDISSFGADETWHMGSLDNPEIFSV